MPRRDQTFNAITSARRALAEAGNLLYSDAEGRMVPRFPTEQARLDGLAYNALAAAHGGYDAA